MKQQIRVLSVMVLIICLSMTVFAGGTQDEQTTEKQNVLEMAPEDVTGTITFWSWMPRPETQFPFLLEAWEKKYPNVELNYERLKKVDHLVRLKTAMLGGDIADVIAINLGDTARPYADKVIPLKSYADMSWGSDWESRFLPLATEWSKEYGTDYPFIPVSLISVPMIVYDANLFREVGAEAPSTYEEFLAVLSKFEGRDDILPHVGAGLVPEDKALSIFFTLIEQIEPDAFLEASEMKRSWTDPVFKKAIERFKKLFDDGFFPKNALSVSLYPDITYDSFVNTLRFPMIYAGSYFMGEVVPSSKETRGIADRRFSVVPFPNLEGGNPVILTGVDQALAIPKECDNKDLAWLFIEFMATEYQPVTGKLMEQFPAKVGVGLDSSVMNNPDEKKGAET